MYVNCSANLQCIFLVHAYTGDMIARRLDEAFEEYNAHNQEGTVVIV